MADLLEQRGKALEDMFFEEHDRQLIAALKAKAAREHAALELGRHTGISDAAVLKRVAELGLTVETLAAFSVMPMIYVAWGDDDLDSAEKSAILLEATAVGIDADSAAYQLLESWLTRAPNQALIDAWKSFHEALASQLTVDERAALKGQIMEKAMRIARASGGFLGIGSVSDDEQAAIARLDALLG